MLKLLSSARIAGRCAYQISRPACPVQTRQYQAALRPSVEESPLPNFDYRALLVDAAGTLLIPSEPAAEVCTAIAIRASHCIPSSTKELVIGIFAVWR